MKSARIVPEKEGDKVVGIRLFGIRPDSLLGTLGIENGDRLSVHQRLRDEQPAEGARGLHQAAHGGSPDRRGQPARQAGQHRLQHQVIARERCLQAGARARLLGRGREVGWWRSPGSGSTKAACCGRTLLHVGTFVRRLGGVHRRRELRAGVGREGHRLAARRRERRGRASGRRVGRQQGGRSPRRPGRAAPAMRRPSVGTRLPPRTTRRAPPASSPSA